MMKAMDQKTKIPGMPGKLTYDMLLDGKDLLRKMRFELAGLQTEMLTSRWGEPVKVQAPAPGRIVSSPQMSG